jgi:lipoprotein-anchoring transpeptidase ErfK/SrfK
VRSPKKYRLPDSRNSPNSGFYWLLVILALAAVAWVWWRAAKTPEPSKSPAKKTLATPTTNQPAHLPLGVAVVPRTITPWTNAPPAAKAILAATNGTFPRPVQNLLEAQLALERMGISSGSLDGKIGSQTRAAMRAFQQEEKIPATGDLDADTTSRLILAAPDFVNYVVTSNDLARLQPLGKTWLAKSQQTALDYETVLELVAEKSHAHPDLIRRLNPGVDWTNVATGTVLQIPDADRDDPPAKAAFVKISLAGKTLEAFGADTNLLAHFPCSIAQRVEKRPVGELHVAVVAPDPNYTFDPAVFPESPEAQQLKMKLVLPPGPNNPVGVVWIGLDKPGYGMHGTPSPELVGRTESHGCFRLANWNAAYLLKLVWIGMPVYVEP